MRILITGFVVFVIWCFISTWLYVDKVLPAMKKPVPVQTVSDSTIIRADSLALLNESVPKNLLIYFEFDKVKFKLDSHSEIRISEIKNWLEKNPSSTLIVTGHTDLVGTNDYNHKLGLKRAEVFKKYLVTIGIPSAKILTDSKGENEPLGDYLTEEGRAMNRRTELSIKTQ